MDWEKMFTRLVARYSGATPDSLLAVLSPLLVPIRNLDKTITKVPGEGPYKASFTIDITRETETWIVRGRTGKFVPASYQGGGIWREIAKGRIVDVQKSIAIGEVYTGSSSRSDLEEALLVLQITDYLEIDQFGAAAKVLSGLVEYSFVSAAKSAGFKVWRMPEDMARHLGAYLNYDYAIERDGKQRKVEVKSIWGTNTRCARLIHSLTTRPKGEPGTWTPEQKANYYPTSSCKFATQDIFAVSLFLRTGNLADWAFAVSAPKDIQPHGLPRAAKYPEHVNQNPSCTIGDGTWFGSLDEVWELV